MEEKLVNSIKLRVFKLENYHSRESNTAKKLTGDVFDFNSGCYLGSEGQLLANLQKSRVVMMIMRKYLI